MWVFRVGMGIHCLHCRLQSKETKVWRWEHQSRWSAVTLQEIRLEFCSLHFNVSLCFPRVSFQSRYRHRLQLRLFAWTDFSVRTYHCRLQSKDSRDKGLEMGRSVSLKCSVQWHCKRLDWNSAHWCTRHYAPSLSCIALCSVLTAPLCTIHCTLCTTYYALLYVVRTMQYALCTMNCALCSFIARD